MCVVEWLTEVFSVVLKGYFGDEALTNDSFRDLDGDGRRWFNTGDVVEYDRRLVSISRVCMCLRVSDA